MAERKEVFLSDLVTSIISLAKFLLSKWLIIFLFAFLGGVLGVMIAWLEKPKYIASLTFFTEGDNKGGLGVYAGLAAQFGLDLGGNGGTAFEGENLMEIFRSKTLVTKTLLTPVDTNSNVLMIDKYLSDNEINRKWASDKKYMNVRFEQNPSKPERLRDSIINKVYENILATDLIVRKRDKKLDLIDVIMESGNEYFSKRFVELLTNNTIDYYTDYKIKKSRQNVVLLQRQTDSIRVVLFGNISTVAEMSDVNLNPLRQVVRTGVQRKQVDLQANGIIYAELVKNLELSKLALRKETPLIQVVDYPSLPLKKIKPGRLLTGIIFAFVTTILVMLYLVVKQWFHMNKIFTMQKQKIDHAT